MRVAEERLQSWLASRFVPQGASQQTRPRRVRPAQPARQQIPRFDDWKQSDPARGQQGAREQTDLSAGEIPDNEYDDIIDAALKPSRTTVTASEPYRTRSGALRFDAPDWNISQLSEIETEYQREFGQPLPVRSRGQGSIHNRWGYQHQNAADIDLSPSSKEGQVLMRRLRERNVPFSAFERAIPGISTGPHIHVGLPSKRSRQQAPAQQQIPRFDDWVQQGERASSSLPSQPKPEPFNSTRLPKPSPAPPTDYWSRVRARMGQVSERTARPAQPATAKRAGTPQLFDPTVPNVVDMVTGAIPQGPRTFDEDRALRTARQKDERELTTRVRQRMSEEADFRGEEYRNFLRLNRTLDDTPRQREAFITLKTQQAVAAANGSPYAALLENDRQRRVAKTSTAQRAAQIPKSITTGIAGEGVGGIIKSTAVAGHKLVGLVTDTGGLDTQDTWVYQFGDYIQKKVPELVRSNPDLEQEFFVGKAPSAVGQSLLFLLGGAVSKSPKLVVSLLGGGMTASDAYDEVRALGGSDDEAMNWGLIAGTVLGPTELLGTRGLLKTIAGTPAEATLRAALKTAFREGRRDAIENALQEIGQEYLQGRITGRRRTFNELLEAAALGAFVGSGTAPVSAGAQLLNRRARGAATGTQPTADPQPATAEPPPVTPPAAASGPTNGAGTQQPDLAPALSHPKFGDVIVVEDQSGATPGRVRVAEQSDPTKQHFVKASELHQSFETATESNLSAGLLEPPETKPYTPIASGQRFEAVDVSDPTVPTFIRNEGRRLQSPFLIVDTQSGEVLPAPTRDLAVKAAKQRTPEDARSLLLNAPKPGLTGDRLITGERADLSLSQFVRKNGGIAPADAYRGELDRLRLRETGTTGLINQKAKQGRVGQTADIVMQMANDAGFRDPKTGQPFENPGDFLYAVERDIAGEKTYSTLRDDAMTDEEFTRREVAYYAEKEALDRAQNARVELLEGGRGAELFDRISDGKATDGERQEFRTLATRLGLNELEIENLISGDGGEVAEVEAPSGPGRAATRGAGQQLGFVPEGLQQQVAPPPKAPDQRERLIREQREREAAANPERTAALRTLEEIKRRGMTVDDYARQPGLFGNVPSPESIRQLKQLESESSQTTAREEPPDLFDSEPVFEERIRNPREKQDVFTMDEGDLADLLDEEFGSDRPAAGYATRRTGAFTFASFAEFEKWMNARFDEADLEGMKLAFAEAPRANKIKYIKANAKADPIKKAWISHLVTLSPLPGEKPPVTRTTPRPMPGGATAGPGTPPRPPSGATPTPPPAPPRAATARQSFDIMALVQLFRQFERFPVVNERLTSAYGRFIPATQMLQLKKRLLWDQKLAQRVLGHEIGHFVDLIIEVAGKGRQLAQRIKPLYSFKGKIGESKELRNEARKLSRAWRGPFSNGDKYRDKASELFADFMSAMLTNPEWVNQNYSKLHDAFDDLLNGKPEFKEAYEELEHLLRNDGLIDEWMDQQREAVGTTVDDLLKDKPRLRQRFRDWLKGAFITTWHRAFEKEGRPAEIGTSIADELEYSNSWAAKENALFADDFQQKVEPELKQVNDDPKEARSLLHMYSQAKRTIGERRAAGIWIEQNPGDARQMLTAVLNISPALNSKFGPQLSTAPDAELYDLAAEIFREAHDLSESIVKRIAKEIDEMDLGVRGDAALQAFNVRGKLLNPGGLTVEQSEVVLDTLKNKLTAKQWTALENAAKDLRDLLFDVQSKAHAEGLISDRIWTELIEPNKDNYLPYAVLDYWDGRVRGGVMPQSGTAKDIADVTLAAQLKAGSLNVWRQKQRQVKLLTGVYAAGGLTIPVGQRLRRASDIEAIKLKHPSDAISRAVMWVDGTPHIVEFPGDPGKTLEKAMDSGSFYEHMEWFADAGRITHSIMQLYTTLSIPFLVYRNPVRGARTSALRMGFGRTGQQLLTPGNLTDSLSLAKNYADAAFGAPMKPELRELIDQQVVLPPRLSAAMVRDAGNLKELLETGGVLATQLRTLKGREWSVWKGGAPTRRAFQIAEKIFTGYEAFEKIYNYKAALKKGKSVEAATHLGRRAGIPKPGVGGHLSFPMEVFFPWTRVHIQGTRATVDMLRDPTMRKGFVTRFVMSEAAPRVMKVLVGAGVIAGALPWFIRGDEDKDDPVMSEVMRRVSPYKMALDDIVPLMFYDAHEGKYHYFNEFKSGAEIPAHYEVVSYRIPASEEGRLWGVLLYNTMVSIPGFKEKMARPGTDMFSNLGQWTFNYALPGISPAIETSSALTDMIVMGKNPEDPFRGAPAANERLFDAGGTDRAQAIAGYTLNQAGGPGEIAAVLAMNFGLLDKRAGESLKRRLAADKTPLPERLPLTRSMFTYDNYGRYREEKTAALAEERLRARSRLVMSDEARQLHDYYYRNLKRADNLTGLEEQRFEASKRFVHRVWGKLDDEDSFYSAAAHAADDGSKEAKETVRRDLDMAATPYMLVFKGEAIFMLEPPKPPKPKAPPKPPDLRDMPIPIAP